MYAVRPFNVSQVCVKELVGNFEISIAFDDSCRPDAPTLGRADIRVYDISTNCDVTDAIAQSVFGNTDVIVGNIPKLMAVFQECNRLSGG